MNNKKNSPILIYRYSSRRLYNTDTSDYVTLDNVADLIRSGADVQIVDKKSGDDITRQILLQIITEHESRGENVLPLNVLTDIVRSYSEQAQSFVPEFLSQSFDAIKNQQEELFGSIQKQIGDAFDPAEAMKNLENFRETQTEMLQSFLKPWIPSTDQEGEKEASDPKTATTDDREKQILEMKKQIEEMQKQLKDL